MIKVTDAKEKSGGVAKISIPNIDENKKITQLFIKNKNTSKYLGSNGWESNVIAIVIEQDERQQYQEGQNKIIKIGPPLVDEIEPHCPIEIIISDINQKEELLWPDITPLFEGLIPPFKTITSPGVLPPTETPPDAGGGIKPDPPITEEKKTKTDL